MSLAVCTVVENPLRWKARLKNYNDFAVMTDYTAGAQLYVVEVAYGDRDFVATREDDRHHLQLRTNSEIWHKENALNLLMQKVTEDYIAWIDCDVLFARPDWAIETVELLKHYDVIQMFSYVTNLGSDYHPKNDGHVGFVYDWITNGRELKLQKEIRTGLAWAARKETLSKIGMLPDWMIVGSADSLMAHAFCGDYNLKYVLHDKEHENYTRKCQTWAAYADTIISRNVGYLPGLILHNYHGEIKNRKYKTKWEILADYDYDPDQYLIRNSQGLYEFRSDVPSKLIIDIKDFLRNRDDDSIEPNRLLP